MYFVEVRETDLQDVSEKITGPWGISCVHPKEVWGLPEKTAGDISCRTTAKAQSRQTLERACG